MEEPADRAGMTRNDDQVFGGREFLQHRAAGCSQLAQVRHRDKLDAGAIQSCQDVALGLNNLGVLYADQKRWADAEKAQLRSLAI